MSATDYTTCFINQLQRVNCSVWHLGEINKLIENSQKHSLSLSEDPWRKKKEERMRTKRMPLQGIFRLQLVS